MHTSRYNICILFSCLLSLLQACASSNPTQTSHVIRDERHYIELSKGEVHQYDIGLTHIGNLRKLLSIAKTIRNKNSNLELAYGIDEYMYLEVADYWYFTNPNLTDDTVIKCFIKDTLAEYKEYIDRYYPNGYQIGKIDEVIRINYLSAIDEFNTKYTNILCK
jgi:hypothetical protein